jgi:ATP-dependent RNA helicase RhlE
MFKEKRDRKPSSQTNFDDFIISSGDSPSRSRGGSFRESSGERRSYSSGNGERNSSQGSRDSSYRGSSRSSFGGGGNRGGGRFGFRSDPRSNRNREEIKHSRYIKSAKASEVISYQPTNTFADMNLHEVLKERIERRGYVTPTAIQDQAIPIILEGKDVIGLANTGTGKTAAFLLPLINKVLNSRSHPKGLPDREILKTSDLKRSRDRDSRESRDRPDFKYLIENEPKALIVVPTRELATQIEDELLAFAPDLRIFSAVCVGGTNMMRQINRLDKVCQIVVGTPGRLLDLIDRGHLNLSQFSTIVLDEVDRMLDMGFIDDVTRIANLLPDHRHSLFFSATMDPKLKPLMSKLLKDPVTVSVLQGRTSDYVDQNVVRVSQGETKFTKLLEILKTEEVKKALIFCQRKVDVDELEYQLQKSGIDCEAIHGDKRQRTRDIAVKRFKQGEVNILIATDVAARGLDIPLVTHVINYDEPENYDDYTHRIGRAGRAGNMGWALTFVR